MVKNEILSAPLNRRQFLFKMLPAGALFGVGCGRLLGSDATEETATLLSETHKYLADAGMTYKEVYELVYKYNFIPYMERLAEYVGREELIELLKRAPLNIIRSVVRIGQKGWRRKSSLLTLIS